MGGEEWGELGGGERCHPAHATRETVGGDEEGKTPQPHRDASQFRQQLHARTTAQSGEPPRIAVAATSTAAVATAAVAVATVTIVVAAVAAAPIAVAVSAAVVVVVLPAGSGQTVALPPSTVDRTDDRAVTFPRAGPRAQGGKSKEVASVRAIASKARSNRRAPLADTPAKEVLLLFLLL